MIPALLLFLMGSFLPSQDEKPVPPEKPVQVPAPAREENPLPRKLAQEPPAQGERLLLVLPEVRLGAWRSGGFKARTPAGAREIDPDLLADAGLDLGIGYAGFNLSLTGDYAQSSDLTMMIGGLQIGANWILYEKDPLPLDLHLAVGVIAGTLDVNAAGFGDFKASVGFSLRAGATAWLWENVGLDFWVDFRQISFKYDEAVTSGDTRTTGSTAAFGAGLLARF